MVTHSCPGAVKYFNNETLERDNFAKAITDYQVVEYKVCCEIVPRWLDCKWSSTAAGTEVSGDAVGLSHCALHGIA